MNFKNVSEPVQVFSLGCGPEKVKRKKRPVLY